MPPDDAYTMMQQGVGDQALSGVAPDPRMAAPPMDPGSMATLFGDDEQGETAPDAEQGEAGGDQAPDQAGGQVDQGKLQSVLSDPGLLMAVAQTLKTLGTGEDTDLVHVTEQEKAMLKQAGGQGTPNPTTGLLQYLTKQEADQQGVDWFGMHPDARVAAIASRGIGVPGWNNNWWTNPGATQGSPTKNMTGEDFANANVAVKPSWGTALNMAGLVTGMATGGPLGAIVGALGKYGFGSVMGDIFGKDSWLAGVGDFSTPGGRLSPDATARVAAAYNDAISRGLPAAQVMNAGEQALESERAALGGGPGAQTGGQGPDLSAGVGVDKSPTPNAYGTNIGGAGVSHNMAAAGPGASPAAMQAAAQAAADRSRAFAARDYGRATPAGGGGGGNRDVGGGGPSGGDRGGGMGGGVGHDHGSNRSM